MVSGTGSGCGVLPKVEISWIWAIGGSGFGTEFGLGLGAGGRPAHWELAV